MRTHPWWPYQRWPIALGVSIILFVAVVMLVQPLAADEAAKPETRLDLTLKERARAFWEARVSENYAAQHSFLEPKLQRSMTVTDFIKQQGPIQYLEARVDGVKVEEARGFVTVRILYQLRLLQRSAPVKQETVFQEEWVRRGGEWYRLYRQG
jgi:hypothetical protein